ncbi:MAG: serine hydroxymethyltransferase, partial [Candidatus Omnitrophica bacterium]|nr:serine hydroxymethyltransferase [Candidatus Omnitrophota bacterium]
EFKEYQRQIVKNSKAFAGRMQELGFRIVSGGTDNHLFLVDLTNKKITGKEAQVLLEQVNITVNKNLIPFDPLPPAQASGIRIGTPAITTRGIKEPEVVKIAEWIDEAVVNRTDAGKLSAIKKEVLKLTKKFPLYPELKGLIE